MNVKHYFTGPRTVPQRTGAGQRARESRTSGCRRGRDGSRSDPELDAVLRNRAFTLIELLVVLALIALGSAMLATGLAHTRANSRLIQCLSNKHQLALACSMYSPDWNDYLVPNAPAGEYRGWCNGTENWTLSPANTNRAYYSNNCLAIYVTGDLRTYKCPDDTIPSDNGDRIRSISMNCMVMGAVPAPTVGINYNAGWSIYKKVSDLARLTPAMGWVFCDENMWSLNDGFLLMGLNTQDYPDVPAAYHGGANCFTFVDGHAEAHRWEWTGTHYSGLKSCPYAKGVTGTHWPSASMDVDFFWLRARSSALMPQ